MRGHGGTDLVRWLRTVLEPQEICDVNTVGRDRHVPWADATAERLAPYRVWAGFAHFEAKDLGRPLVAVTVVRHPFYRNVAVYERLRDRAGHSLHGLATASSFDNF